MKLESHIRPDRASQMLEFLRLLFGTPKGLLYLLALPSKARAFVGDLDLALDFATKHLHENVFVGGCPRYARTGAKAGVAFARALYADIDWKDYKGGKKDADRYIRQFPLPPSIIVKSGYGYHLYWLLATPVRAGPHIEGLLAGIAKRLGADRAAAELARVLRLPGTFNHKYGTRRPVELYKSTRRQYSLEDFAEFERVTNRGTTQAVKFAEVVMKNVDIANLPITDRIKRMIEAGPDLNRYRSRSEADQAVITALVKGGVPNDEIKAIFQNYAIGQKYREKAAAADLYLSHSIASARQFLTRKEHS